MTTPLCSAVPAEIPSADPASKDALSDVPSVASLLTRSRAAALARTALANRLRGKHHRPDYAAATEQARLALTLRQQAHALDPDHTDPAWGLDMVSHADVCAFLQAYLEQP